MDRKPPQNCAFCWQRLLSCNTRHCLNKRRRTHSLDKPDNEPEAKEIMVNGRSGFGKFRPGNLLHLCWWSSHGSLHSYIQPGAGNNVWRSNPKDWQTPSSKQVTSSVLLKSLQFLDHTRPASSTKHFLIWSRLCLCGAIKWPRSRNSPLLPCSRNVSSLFVATRKTCKPRQSQMNKFEF